MYRHACWQIMVPYVSASDMKECFKVATVLESAAEIYQKALAIGKPQEITKENTDWMRDFAVNHYGQK
jgi:ribulose-5-phosphate 4-epimerase/fuculose-1-phosphate aldolase